MSRSGHLDLIPCYDLFYYHYATFVFGVDYIKFGLTFKDQFESWSIK